MRLLVLAAASTSAWNSAATTQGRRDFKERYFNLGKAPENKVTPELAALPGSGLHPLTLRIHATA